MSRKQFSRIRSMDRMQELRSQLFEAIHSLQSVEECYRFFEDLCTVNEVRHFALRLEIAKRLRQGQTYLDIIIETNASSECIARIKRNMARGKGGIHRALDRLENSREMNVF